MKLSKTESQILELLSTRKRGRLFIEGKRQVAAARNLVRKGLISKFEPAGSNCGNSTRKGFWPTGTAIA